MNTKEGRFVQDAAQVFDGIPRSGVSTGAGGSQVFDFIRKHINSATILLTGNSVCGIAISEDIASGSDRILDDIVCDLPRRSHRDAFRHRDVQLVSAEAAFRHRDAAFTEDHWRCLGTL
ncbi:uncharacterized protein [Miscanthus floridulus]|uniref:uncharacterized protein n=1 Tax=Miscanthus floridulus TaxID=154761 RepID=UPI00345B26E8